MEPDSYYIRLTNRMHREQQERDDKTWIWVYSIAAAIFGGIFFIWFVLSFMMLSQLRKYTKANQEN